MPIQRCCIRLMRFMMLEATGNSTMENRTRRTASHSEREYSNRVFGSHHTVMLVSDIHTQQSLRQALCEEMGYAIDLLPGHSEHTLDQTCVAGPSLDGSHP